MLCILFVLFYFLFKKVKLYFFVWNMYVGHMAENSQINDYAGKSPPSSLSHLPAPSPEGYHCYQILVSHSRDIL